MPSAETSPGHAGVISIGHRTAVALLLAAATGAALALILFASRACPGPADMDACASAAANRATVVALASLGVALFVTPFAFLGEYAARRRIVYRGSWSRAARRGAVMGIVVAVLAGLRLGGALTAPLAAAVVLAPIALETYVTRTELRRGPVP